MKKTIASFLILAFSMVTVPALALSDVEIGEKVFIARCAVCHALDSNKIGPMARTMYGRAAGRVTGYNYSLGIRNMDLAWTDGPLDQFLKNPTAMVPDTKMTMRLPEAIERYEVIAYLKALAIAAKK